MSNYCFTNGPTMLVASPYEIGAAQRQILIARTQSLGRTYTFDPSGSLCLGVAQKATFVWFRGIRYADQGSRGGPWV